MPKKKNDRITCGFNCQTQMEKQAVGYLGLDCRERVLFCDQAAQTILNRPQQDILEQPITNFYPEFSVAAALSPEGIILPASNLSVRGTVRPVTSDDGSGLSYIVLLENPVERESFERCVMEDLQEIIEGSFDGILVTDGEGNVQLVNQGYVHNTGIPKEQLLGHNMQELINPVWMKDSVVFLVKKQRAPVSLRHTTQNGNKVIVTGMPIFNEAGEIKRIVVNSRDISEIYALNHQLQEAKNMERIYMESLNSVHASEQNKENLIIHSAAMQQVFRIAKRLSAFNSNVLITGESGVGKEEVTRYIHRNSLRAKRPFVAVNCGAIPENLLESELFGYEGGAFTGALKTGKAGLFEAANGGTLMLDEVGEMPLSLQVKLLRVLESREVVRIGGNQAIPVDVRIISATNQDLEEMAKQGKFREDLYYRLNVVRLDIPPLRERPEDIPPLSLMFINRFNSQYGMNKQFTYPVLRELQKQVWRGNVRELKNTIENMFVLSSRDYLQIQDLPWRRDREQEPIKHEQTAVQSLDEAVADFERQLLQSARQRCGSTRQMAAELKVDQSTVVRKMKKYGLVQ